MIATVNGSVTTWNLAAAKLYGWQPGETLGQALSAILGDYPDEAKTAITDQGSWEGCLDRHRFNGEQASVRVRCVNGASVGMTTDAIVEVSSSREPAHPAEVKLAASEYRYRNLFGAVAAAFWEIDFSGVGALLQQLDDEAKANLDRYFAANPAFVRQLMRATRNVDANDRAIELFGPGTKRELLAQSADAYWPEESTKDYAAAVLAAIAGKPHFVAETRLRTVAGRVFDTLFTVSFLPNTVGRGTLLIGVTDISDRVRAVRDLDQASLRQKMFSEVPLFAISELQNTALIDRFDALRAKGVVDLSAYIDENPEFMDFALDATRFVEANDAAVRMLRARSRDDLVGRPLRDVFEPARDIFRQSIQRTFRGEEAYQDELRMTRLDGTFVDTITCRLVSPKFGRDRVLLAQVDISEQVRGREALEQLRGQVAHAARISMLGELSASIAHEISQPITAIATGAAAAERIAARYDIPTGLLSTATHRISRDAARAAGIIGRIRAMASNKTVQFAPLSISHIIGDAHALVAREMRDRSVDVQTVVPTALPMVLGDPVQLQQVIVNLMLNAAHALEAVERDRRHIILSAQAADGEILVSISDTGPGFPEDRLDSPFKTFQSSKDGGLGLGLSICRSIIDTHGGTLTIGNNEDASGALIAIRLPRSRTSGPES